MSKRKDRERAESGIIHRDGKLVRKEEWYASHPTREMLKERQAGVDKFVAEEMAKKLDFKDQSAVMAEAGVKFSYFCSKCNHRHTEGSKICTDHRQYARTPITLRKEA